MVRKGYKQTKEHIMKRVTANRGKKRTKETRQKMRLSHLGKHCSEETKKKLSAIFKGRVPWNKNKNGLQVAWNKGIKTGFVPRSAYKKGNPSPCGMLGKKHTLETKEKMRNVKNTPVAIKKARYWGNLQALKQQNSKEPTGIEKKVYEELKARGLLFEKQKLINGRFLVDAYIPSLNLVIEADGKYWHNLDRVVKKDKAENAYLTKCGFNLLRLTETEINDGSFKERMVS